MELHLGDTYTVTVSKILTGGIIVEFENGETEFIHKSKISNAFISDINDFVAIGESYTARVIEGKTKPIELTLREDNVISKKLQVSSEPVKPVSIVETAHAEGEEIGYTNPTLEDMISKATSSMREKFQGRDKTTGARYKKSRRGSKNK